MDVVERVQASFKPSIISYTARVANGQQPAPPDFVTANPWLAFLDYRNTNAIFGVNAAYIVVVAFLYIVMWDRPQGFQLRWLMALYNAVCVGLATYVCVGVAKYKMVNSFTFVCNKPDFTPAGKELSLVIWAYYAQKFLEYGDTIFFLLRKSFRQVTFLHIYHHVSITLVTAAFLRFDVNADDYLAAFVNSFVHVLMYSHYLLAAFKINTWWKRQLTTLQLLQFSLVLGQTAYAYVKGGPNCGSPDWLKVVMIAYQVTMLVLFGLFYIASYLSGGEKRATRKDVAPATAEKKDS